MPLDLRNHFETSGTTSSLTSLVKQLLFTKGPLSMGSAQSDALDASEGVDRFEVMMGCCDGRKDLWNKLGR